MLLFWTIYSAYYQNTRTQSKLIHHYSTYWYLSNIPKPVVNQRHPRKNRCRNLKKFVPVHVQKPHQHHQTRTSDMIHRNLFSRFATGQATFTETEWLRVEERKAGMPRRYNKDGISWMRTRTSLVLTFYSFLTSSKVISQYRMISFDFDENVRNRYEVFDVL